MSKPSALEQYMLELINAERAKVGAQPLALDGGLNASTELHSEWMISSGVFAHTGEGGSTPVERMQNAGFDFVGSSWAGENIAYASTRAPESFADEVRLLHTNLMNSSGHRANILNGTFREVGIGFETVDSAYVTQNFARTGSNPIMTGVAIDDKDGDHAYDINEGVGRVLVRAVNDVGEVFKTRSYGSGGYDLQLAPGAYEVTFSKDGVSESAEVTIGSRNVEVDWLL